MEERTREELLEEIEELKEQNKKQHKTIIEFANVIETLKGTITSQAIQLYGRKEKSNE